MKRCFLLLFLMITLYTISSYAIDNRYLYLVGSDQYLILNNRDKNDTLIKYAKVIDIEVISDSMIIVATKNKGIYKFIKKDSIFKMENFSKGLDKKRIIDYKLYRNIIGIKYSKEDNKIFATSKYKIFYSNNFKTWKKFTNDKFRDITAFDYGLKTIILGTALTGIYIKFHYSPYFYRVSPPEIKNTMSKYESVSMIKVYKNNLYIGFNFNNILFKIPLKRLKVLNNTEVSLKNGKIYYVIEDSSIIRPPHNSIYDIGFISDTSFIAVTREGIYFAQLKNDSIYWSKNQLTDYIEELINLYYLNNKEKIRVIVLKYGDNYIKLKKLEYVKLRYVFYDKNKKLADRKYCLYLPVWRIRTPDRARKLLNFIKSSKINCVVVDLKDDFGYIRYYSKLNIVKKVESRRAVINLKEILPILKEDSIYFVARMVVFKDPQLWKYENNKYAVWDCKGDSAFWTKKEAWVDQYSRFVWEYNVKIAKELEQLGVDEIQFDYIRFPTDNLPKGLCFRYKPKGAEKRDALESFLKMARDSISIPISVDIYGGSGWYNKSTGVAQELDMLKDYVDAICPMYYPSHFRDNFLNYPPYEERPFRIYYQGTLRLREFTHDEVLVRPYIQSFCLKGLSKYDRKYCSIDYVIWEIKGCESANSNGYSFWNAAGRYNKFLGPLFKSILKKGK